MALIHFRRMGCLAGILAAWTGVGFAQNTSKNGIAGVVNNEAITLQEIQRQTYMEEQDLRNQQISGRITKEEMVKKIRERWSTVLDSLIEKKLILQDYKKKGYSFPDYFFEREEKQRIRDLYGGDRQALIKTLEERGQTLAEWKKDIHDTFIVQQMRVINAKKYITISPHMIEAYYQQHVRDFLQPDRVKMRMISVSSGGSENPEATAKEVLARVESGDDFADLAKKYSDYNRANGGLWEKNGGWLERGDLIPAVSEVAFQLRPGQSSGLIAQPTADGRSVFYILHVEEVKKATVTPLSSIRDAIESTLQAAESEKVQRDWIDRLKRDAYIEKFL